MRLVGLFKIQTRRGCGTQFCDFRKGSEASFKFILGPALIIGAKEKLPCFGEAGQNELSEFGVVLFNSKQPLFAATEGGRVTDDKIKFAIFLGSPFQKRKAVHGPKLISTEGYIQTIEFKILAAPVNEVFTEVHGDNL